MLKTKNLKIQIMSDDSSSSNLKLSFIFKSLNDALNISSDDVLEETFINDLNEQITIAYINDVWIQSVIIALRNDDRKLSEISLAEC